MRTAPALLIASLLVIGLAGCGTDDRPAEQDPSPSATPIFASDEEALAAAEEAYGAYLEASDLVLHEGGSNPERALKLVADEYREEAAESFTAFTERSWRSEGSTLFDSVELQQYQDDGEGKAEVALYVCLDISQTTIFDAAGADVTPSSRPLRIPLVVEMTNSQASNAELLQSGSEVWSGTDFCS